MNLATLYSFRATFKKPLDRVPERFVEITRRALTYRGVVSPTDDRVASFDTDMLDCRFQVDTLVAGYSVKPAVHLILSLDHRIRLADEDAWGYCILPQWELCRAGQLLSVGVSAPQSFGRPEVTEVEVQLLGYDVTESVLRELERLPGAWEERARRFLLARAEAGGESGAAAQRQLGGAA